MSKKEVKAQLDKFLSVSTQFLKTGDSLEQLFQNLKKKAPIIPGTIGEIF